MGGKLPYLIEKLFSPESERHPAVARDDILDVVPAVRAAKDRDDKGVGIFIKRSHKTRLCGPRIAGLAVNFLFPVIKKNFVMTLERDFPPVSGINHLIFFSDSGAKKNVPEGLAEDHIHVISRRILGAFATGEAVGIGKLRVVRP